MRILLIYPKVNAARGTVVKYSLVPPQSLTAVAALTPEEHEVRIVDENHDRIDYNADVDLVGITVFISSASHAYDVASKFRLRGIPVVLGGLHVTSFPEHAQPHADVIVVGEAEVSWPQLLRDMEEGRLKKRYEQDAPPCLHGLPLPRRDLIKGSRYLTRNSLLATRGCPYRCRFCYRSSLPPSNFRKRPVGDVLSEIETFEGRHAVLLDDNIVADREYAKELFGAMAKKNLAWLGAGSLDMAGDPELMDLLRASGCKSLFIGFETLSEENLRSVSKSSNRIERYEHAVRTIHDHGIMINASFVYGFDNDDPEVFERTVRWGIENALDTATFHILTPYPGTSLAAQFEQEGRIIDRNFDHYDTAHAVFHPMKMTPAELEAGYLWSYREFYTWKSVIQRAFYKREGAAERLIFNVCYKKFEPFWEVLINCDQTSWVWQSFVNLVHLCGRNRVPKTVGYARHESRSGHDSAILSQ